MKTKILSLLTLLLFLVLLSTSQAAGSGLASSEPALQSPATQPRPADALLPLSSAVAPAAWQRISSAALAGSPTGTSGQAAALLDNLPPYPRPATAISGTSCPGTVSGPVFWDKAPQSSSLIVVGDQQIIQPGPDDTVRVIIQLKADPLATYKSRLQATAGQLAQAEWEQIAAYARGLQREQQRLLNQIRNQGIELELRRAYHYLFNGLAASVKVADMERIAALPSVKGVYPDYQVHASLEQSVPLIGAPQVWTMRDAHGQPVTGKGVRVAIVDTGIDYTHPDLGGCFGAGCKVMAGYDFVNGDGDPWDDNGHGTHCAGIVAANGALKGVAPDATLYAYKLLDKYGSGWDSDIIAAIERATDPDGNPATDDAVDIISMSLGGAGDPDEPLALAVDAAVDEGVVVAVAAGNGGPGYQTVSSPGVARKAFTVGATDKSDNIAPFSSRGPVTDFYELTKPEIVAPGYGINSTYPGGGYASLSGTSMSTPHIAGAAALIKQLHPTWTPEMIQANLMNRAKDLGVDIYTQGAGRVQVDDAVSAQAVLVPGALSFGMVDASQPVWTKTKTLQLINVGDGAVSYSLQVSGDLPAGVTTDLDPASVTLGPGESVDITFQISVDNALTPYQNQEPGSYQGQVIAQPTAATQAGVQGVGDPLVVPFAFIKSPLLEITFDESPWIVLIHDREKLRAWRGYPPEISRFLLPEGTYDVWVIYNPPDTWVIREGVVVSGHTRLSIRRSDAVHTVTLRPRDRDGHPIYPWDWLLAQQLTHTPSGYWIGVGWRRTPPLTFHFSQMSADYTWEWRLDTGWQGAYYEFNDRLNGISGDVTYQNNPGDLWHIRHVCHPGPGFSQVRLGFYWPYG